MSMKVSTRRQCFLNDVAIDGTQHGDVQILPSVLSVRAGRGRGSRTSGKIGPCRSDCRSGFLVAWPSVHDWWSILVRGMRRQVASARE